MHKPLFVLVGSMCLAFMVHAEIYQWTDAKGKTHYSDRKPLDQSPKTLTRDELPLILRQQPVAVREFRPARNTSQRRRRSHSKDNSAACERYEKRLAAVREKLRRGYREPQGNRLRQQRRKWSELVHKECH